MKGTIKANFFSIILMLTIAPIVSIKIIAQSKTAKPKNSEVKVLDKEAILEAKLSGNKFQSGSPVELTLKVKNKTNSTVVLFDVTPERSFDITIKDANGLSLSLTEEGRKRKYPVNIVRRETVFLESGKELVLRNIRLDKLFDLKRTGNYTLEVKRTYYLQETSNKNAGLESEDKILTGTVKFNIR